MEDIVAMKLSAIADDGSRLKDFVDIACWKIQCKLPPKTKRFCPLVLK